VGSACAQASGANAAATTQNLIKERTIGLDTHDKCPVAANREARCCGVNTHVSLRTRQLKRLAILASFCQVYNFCLYSELTSITSAPTAHGLPSRRIESSHGKLTPRQRASFVAIQGRKLPRLAGKNRREFLWPLTLCR